MKSDLKNSPCCEGSVILPGFSLPPSCVRHSIKLDSQGKPDVNQKEQNRPDTDRLGEGGKRQLADVCVCKKGRERERARERQTERQTEAEMGQEEKTGEI